MDKQGSKGNTKFGCEKIPGLNFECCQIEKHFSKKEIGMKV
jgi:hypothetical protein